MASNHLHVTEPREDISRFVVHLTRDDRKTFTNGGTAKSNFLSIMRNQKIVGYRAHCLHGAQVNELDAGIQDRFRVACFTEVPLSQVHHLVGEINGRQIELAPYGFVFTKKYLISKGGQPAIYINSYQGNSWLREAVDWLYDSAASSKFSGKMWRLLPFVNAMHEKYDFTWEREWRVRGTFQFSIQRLVCVILPETGDHEKLRELLATSGIAAISPGWTYERIVAELASQQRKTRVLLKDSEVSKEPGDKKVKPNAPT